MLKLFKKRIIYLLNTYVRTNAFLTRILFGVKILGNERIHWDFTTLVLKKCLKNFAKPGMKILEIGTGPFSILSIYISKKIECSIDACDVNFDYVLNAEKTNMKNNANVNIFLSNLYSNVKENYDIIFFNSVYIPETTGRNLKLDSIHKFKTDWCGGENGTEILEMFARDSGNYLKSGGIILLGVNYLYLDKVAVNNIFLNNNFNIKKNYKTKLNPSSVLILNKN